jgi:hypothetical protein
MVKSFLLLEWYKTETASSGSNNPNSQSSILYAHSNLPYPSLERSQKPEARAYSQFWWVVLLPFCGVSDLWWCHTLLSTFKPLHSQVFIVCQFPVNILSQSHKQSTKMLECCIYVSVFFIPPKENYKLVFTSNHELCGLEEGANLNSFSYAFENVALFVWARLRYCHSWFLKCL